MRKKTNKRKGKKNEGKEREAKKDGKVEGLNEVEDKSKKKKK